MFRDLPVARLSAALEGTKPSFSATEDTFSRVRCETEPCPDSARDAVDFDTPASLATSASLVMVDRLADSFNKTLSPVVNFGTATSCGAAQRLREARGHSKAD